MHVDFLNSILNSFVSASKANKLILKLFKFNSSLRTCHHSNCLNNYLYLFVSRALKSVFVDLSLPKRRALFDFLRDPQFVKLKLTYLFMRTAKGWNSTIILDFGATSVKWVSRHETMVTKLGVFTKTVKFEVSVSSKKCLSPVGEVSSTPILHDIVIRLTRNNQ
jgi:hypothetical protein